MFKHYSKAEWERMQKEALEKKQRREQEEQANSQF
jgi:hypothetical protein